MSVSSAPYIQTAAHQIPCVAAPSLTSAYDASEGCSRAHLTQSKSRASNGPCMAGPSLASAWAAGDGRSRTRQAQPSSCSFERTAAMQSVSGRGPAGDAAGNSSFFSLGRPTPAASPNPAQPLSKLVNNIDEAPLVLQYLQSVSPPAVPPTTNE